MNFRTEIPAPKYPFDINYNHKLMLLGSCFSDHIGQFFKNLNFDCCSNPFGTLFNPISIANALEMSMNPDLFGEKYIDFFNEKWISYAHHGRFSNADKDEFLRHIHEGLFQSHEALSQADFLFLTFGTAYCYRLIERDMIVANCHKIPAHRFEKICLSIERIVALYQDLFQELKDKNSKLKIIFTVSPVRHLGDGFHENQISKSILHLLVNQFVDNENVFYFPAYEILQDDLRDYRFYADDLCHPSTSAVTYISEKLSEAFFSKITMNKVREVIRENKLKGHIPLM